MQTSSAYSLLSDTLCRQPEGRYMLLACMLASRPPNIPDAGRWGTSGVCMPKGVPACPEAGCQLPAAWAGVRAGADMRARAAESPGAAHAALGRWPAGNRCAQGHPISQIWLLRCRGETAGRQAMWGILSPLECSYQLDSSERAAAHRCWPDRHGRLPTDPRWQPQGPLKDLSALMHQTAFLCLQP